MFEHFVIDWTSGQFSIILLYFSSSSFDWISREFFVRSTHLMSSKIDLLFNNIDFSVGKNVASKLVYDYFYFDWKMPWTICVISSIEPIHMLTDLNEWSWIFLEIYIQYWTTHLNCLYGDGDDDDEYTKRHFCDNNNNNKHYICKSRLIC